MWPSLEVIRETSQNKVLPDKGETNFMMSDTPNSDIQERKSDPNDEIHQLLIPAQEISPHIREGGSFTLDTTEVQNPLHFWFNNYEDTDLVRDVYVYTVGKMVNDMDQFYNRLEGGKWRMESGQHYPPGTMLVQIEEMINLNMPKLPYGKSHPHLPCYLADIEIMAKERTRAEERAAQTVQTQKALRKTRGTDEWQRTLEPPKRRLPTKQVRA